MEAASTLAVVLFMRPLQKLTATTTALAAGDLSTRSDITTDNDDDTNPDEGAAGMGADPDDVDVDECVASCNDDACAAACED